MVNIIKGQITWETGQWVESGCSTTGVIATNRDYGISLFINLLRYHRVNVKVIIRFSGLI